MIKTSIKEGSELEKLLARALKIHSETGEWDSDLASAKLVDQTGRQFLNLTSQT